VHRRRHPYVNLRTALIDFTPKLDAPSRWQRMAACGR
jgi:hypothetical protein